MLLPAEEEDDEDIDELDCVDDHNDEDIFEEDERTLEREDTELCEELLFISTILRWNWRCSMFLA